MKNSLLENFYTETSSTFDYANPDAFKVQIYLNAEHPIYKGHFEQVPITPGVCQVQIIKEILMEKFNVALQLTESDNLKFLAMIDPRLHPELGINFSLKKTETTFDVNAVISHETSTFTKFKGKFLIL